MTPLRASIWERIPSVLSGRIYIYFLRFDPNLITFVSGMFGLFGLFLILVNPYGFGAPLGCVSLIIFLVLDFIDGDVARATGKQSALGAWLDPFFDKIIEGGILVVSGFFYLNEHTSQNAFFVVGPSIVLFQLNQFLLVMDMVILHKQNASNPEQSLGKKDTPSKKRQLIDGVIKHFSLGHAALVISFIVFVSIGFVEHLSLIYLLWSSLTILPTLLAKGRRLLLTMQ